MVSVCPLLLDVQELLINAGGILLPDRKTLICASGDYGTHDPQYHARGSSGDSSNLHSDLQIDDQQA